MDNDRYGVSLVDSLARHPRKRYKQRPLDAVDLLVVHHSAGPPTIGPARIAKMHIAVHDWPGIGYHFAVTDDGTVAQTNELTTWSYHAAGYNRRSVGILFLGNFMELPPPACQIQAGGGLLCFLLKRFGLGIGAIVGHKELMKTACPGRQWLEGACWKDQLLSVVVGAR